ncbi:acetate/propionate family kinase [Alkalibacterium olivapovliticus]|uniref:Acetate kinase n=1 Tax=Alkalibacterium olivapovliticus TaxID=99907 RepID=A0A2T0WB35_9LACT|nr:acetate kinase [Alkalibacterium olivapovliticus]PRY83913.1 acetate kinase [Alkalibacterium olivapovliticus]
MTKTIAINAGSSSLKWKLYNMPQEKVLASGIVERIGLNDSIFTIKYNDGEKYETVVDIDDHEVAVEMLLEQLKELNILADFNEITGVGHRVVAGGEIFKDSALVTDEVIKQIEDLSEFAPLHNPANATGIKAFRKILPDITSVAVFDTSFHQTMPKVNYLYSIPLEYYEKHNARKYGAHGTSHKYVSQRAAELLGKPLEDTKIITCHLGNGASITAVDGGKSVDTSMGFTPLAGVTMGTRSGDIDPSLLPFLMEKEGIKTIGGMIDILNNESGLKGLSGISSDMRDLEDAEATDPKAELALRIFEDRVRKYIGSYAATMNGVDAIVFTAGIGENGSDTRKNVIDGLTFLGAEIDEEKNNVRGKEREISSENSKVKVYLIPTDEEVMIARDVEKFR